MRIEEIDARIRRSLARIRGAVRMVISRINSAPAVCAASGEALAGEAIVEAEVMQDYGFTSVPPAGTMGVVIPQGGRTSHGVVVATEHATYRLKALQTGEVAIYTDEGTKIVLKRGRVIETECDVFRVHCQTWEVNARAASHFNTPVLTASGQTIVQGGLAVSGGSGTAAATITGTLHTTGDVVAGGVSLQHHVHPVPALGISEAPLA